MRMLRNKLSERDMEVFKLLKEHISNTIKWSAYNWVRPSLWSAMFTQKVAEANGANSLHSNATSNK